MKAKTFFRLLFIGVLSLAIFIGYSNFISKKSVWKVKDNDKQIISSTSIVKDNITIKISALGDVALGQGWKYNYTDSFDYVFKKKYQDYRYF